MAANKRQQVRTVEIIIRGHNAAGKTTILKQIAPLLASDDTAVAFTDGSSDVYFENKPERPERLIMIRTELGVANIKGRPDESY